MLNIENKKISGDFAKEFLQIYLSKGFGLMNKSEMEILLYHLLVKHKVLKNKCFDDSLDLEIPETKVRKLIYESELKYGIKDSEKRDYEFRLRIGECLQNAYFDKAGTHVQFAVESQYLRNYIYAKLRDNHKHADSSFNKDIVSVNYDALATLIKMTIPNKKEKEFIERLSKEYSIRINKDKSLDEVIRSVDKIAFGTIDRTSKIKTGIGIIKSIGGILAVI